MKRKLFALTLAALMALSSFAVLADEAEPVQESTEEAAAGEEAPQFDPANTPLEDWPEYMPEFLRDMFYPQVPEAEEGKVHIACIGDSITWGAGVLVPDMARELTYPSLLQEKLGDEYQVLNYGMSGRTLLAEGDDPYTEENFYELSHEAAADIYVIMLGTNDSKPYNWNAEKYRSELTDFVKSYMSLENAPAVYVMTPPAAFVVDGADAVGYDIQAETIEEEVAPIVREVASELGAHLIDMFEETKDHPEWFPDGVHPGAEGNEEFARIVMEGIGLA